MVLPQHRTWWVALPMTCFGVLVSLVSLGPSLEILVDGRRHRSAVCVGHRFDAELFIDALDDLITAESRPEEDHT